MAVVLKAHDYLIKGITVFLYGVDLGSSILLAWNIDLLTHGGLKH